MMNKCLGNQARSEKGCRDGTMMAVYCYSGSDVVLVMDELCAP